MGKRGRPSTADKILDDLDDTEEDNFLVLYDFSSKPSLYFYKNVKIIQEKLEDGVRIQASVYQCRLLKTARAIDKLARHYGANCLVFRVESIE